MEEKLPSEKVAQLCEDRDGVRYDSSRFVQNNAYLDNAHTQERGYVDIVQARAVDLTNPVTGKRYYPNSGELMKEGDYHVLREAGLNTGKSSIVVAIPSEVVSKVEVAPLEKDELPKAVTQNLHEVYQKIGDVLKKMDRDCPDQIAALNTIQKDVLTVNNSITARCADNQDTNHWQTGDYQNKHPLGIYPRIEELAKSHGYWRENQNNSEE